MTKTVAHLWPTNWPEACEEDDLIQCHYTGAMIARREAIRLGPIIPQVNVTYICHPLAADARKASLQLFYETEQNCNTCRFLIRVPFDRRSARISGLMPGKCNHPSSTPLYPKGGDNIMFAPDDCMLQPCYEQRRLHE